MTSPLLEVHNASRTFSTGTSPFSRQTFAAVDGVSFCLERGRTLGVVGEFGLGKVDPAADDPPAYPTDRRPNPIRRSRRLGSLRARSIGSSPANAGDLSGPGLVVQSASIDRRHPRRPARSARRRDGRRAGQSRRRNPRTRWALRKLRVTTPSPALRRPAPARRHRAGYYPAPILDSG